MDVDLENCDDVFRAVKKQVTEAHRGLEQPLLSMMQNLLTLPTSGEAGYVGYGGVLLLCMLMCLHFFYQHAGLVCYRKTYPTGFSP